MWGWRAYVYFQQYGDIRTLYTACKPRGFVMISYYDLRAARNAMRALQNKALRGRNLDIHFSIPKVPLFLLFLSCQAVVHFTYVSNIKFFRITLQRKISIRVPLLFSILIPQFLMMNFTSFLVFMEK